MKYIIVYAILFFTTQVNAWVVIKDFESGAVGSSANKNASGFKDGFDNNAGSALYSAKYAVQGKQSASTFIEAGDNGFGRFGGKFSFPSPVNVGDEIWYRTATYFPSDFEFDSAGGLGKGMRLHTTQSDGAGNGGYVDIYFKRGLQTISNEASLNDFIENNPDWKKKGSPIENGRWVYFEQYVKVAAKPNAGIYRVWQDGILIHEDTKTYTVQSATSTIDFAYYLTFWNAGSPKDNTLWIDDVVITNEMPDEVDSFGNPYLGVGAGSVSFTAFPRPPSQPQ